MEDPTEERAKPRTAPHLLLKLLPAVLLAAVVVFFGSGHAGRQHPAQPLLQEKQRFVERVEARLVRWDARLQRLRARTGTLEPAARRALEHRLEVLRKMRIDARMIVERVKNASAESWREAERDVRNGWRDLSLSFRELTAQLS